VRDLLGDDVLGVIAACAPCRKPPEIMPDESTPSMPYPSVRLRSGTGHMYVYQRMIADVDPQARAGDVVAVYDKSNRLFGHAFYHDRSQIALRMLSYEAAPIDEEFFRRRLAAAVSWRQRLIPDTSQTDACRLVHSEGDGISGLIAERYADWIVIEVFSLGVYRRLAMFQRLLTELTGVTKFVVRADERIQRIEGFRVDPKDTPEDAQPINVRENGLRFRVDLRRGHKTGFFCDQRDNRRRLGELARGASVLDVCCYTGGFGVYARAAGAEQVTGVDLDEDAIELAKKNANLNSLRIQHVHADAFSYLRQMQTNGRTFDIVVLDPPKFIGSRDEFHEGSRKYVDLNTLGASVVAPGGLLLTCSCSGSVSPDDFIGMVRAAAQRAKRQLQFVDFTGAAPDHPVMANCPESAYLKAIWARLF
jgi:23S rRNA (cytosine1962-C5)-methyltransferase